MSVPFCYYLVWESVLFLDLLVTAWLMKNLFTFVTTNWNFFINHAVTKVDQTTILVRVHEYCICLVLIAQASLSDHAWLQSDNPSNSCDDSSPCFTWNPLIKLLTTDKSTCVLNCIWLNWNFHNELCTTFPSGSELQADHPLHRVREDEGAGLSGQEGAPGSADEGSHPAGKHWLKRGYILLGSD